MARRSKYRQLLVVVLALGLGWMGIGSLGAAEPAPKHWSFAQAALIPIQSGGRVKPLDSYAREVVLYLTGSRKFQGWNPIEMLASMMVQPEAWEKKAFLRISQPDVLRFLVMDEGRKYFSPEELTQNPVLAQYAAAQSGMRPGAGGMGAQAAPPTVVAKGREERNPREDELKRVLGRLATFRALVSGTAWQLIPQGHDAPWLNIIPNQFSAVVPETQAETVDARGHVVESKTPGSSAASAAGQPSEAYEQEIRSLFLKWIAAYQEGTSDIFEMVSGDMRTTIEGHIEGWGPEPARKLRAESWYHRVDPFFWTLVLYLLSSLVWMGVSATRTRQKLFWEKNLKRLGMALTGVAFLFHAFGFGLRMYVSGRPPVSNMYESVIWVSFGILIFSFILYRIQKRPVIPAVATFLGALALFAADSAPLVMDPYIHPLVPVLRSNYWLTIHVLTITLSYGAFALSLGIANISLFHYLKGALDSAYVAKSVNQASQFNQLAYRTMQFGVVLLAAGTILGGVWADASWGRFWGWDPKEVWALIALLCYLALLHARLTGWVSQFVFSCWTVLSFLSVIMAWYGVNFVLGVGLHSYGFSSGGGAAVGIFSLLQLLYVAFVALLWNRVKAKAYPVVDA